MRMSDTELLESKRAQMEVLQNRIVVHGSRMWQLPLTYLGALAIGLSAVTSKGVELSLSVVFFFMALLGLILLWCLHGAAESYTRSAKNMNELEADLGLEEYTNAKTSHRYPYYALMIFGIICSLTLGWQL